jgi:cystathionine beta-lyase/cystathionine gamma-synthase
MNTVELQTHTNSFRNALASIENGARGLAFSSGLAATDCLMRGLKPGDEVIAMDDLYGELTDCLRIKIQVYYSIL